MPVHLFAQRTTNQRAKPSAQIDPHVEHRKTSIAPTATFRKEFTHHCAHIRFQQPRSDDDENQTQVKTLCSWNCQCEMAARDNDASVPNRVSGANESVRHPSSRQ